MGIRFQGFFLTGDDALGDEIRADWPTAVVRRITEPFEGWDIALPTEEEEFETEEYNQPSEAPSERVLKWSLSMPGKTIVYLDADCFGGTCLYEGFACRDGKRIREERMARRGTGVLRRLMAEIGMELPEDEYFLPLTREYLR